MKILQRLHGDYIAHKGQRVKPQDIIGYGNGHGPGQDMASHDHTSVGYSTGTHNGWYNGCNKTYNPNSFIYGFTANDINGKFVFNQAKGWGGYGYLEQTPYTWYTDCRDSSKHDGIDYFAPLGSKLYAGVYGTITDVGRQANGLTYLYIKIEEMKWHKGKNNLWWYGSRKDFYCKSEWLLLKGKWYYFDKNGYMLTGKHTIKGKSYNFNSKGEMI